MSVKTTRLFKLKAMYAPRVKQWGGYREVPCLNISGVWLEQAGFKAGDRVEIMIANKSLIIKNLGHDGDQSH